MGRLKRKMAISEYVEPTQAMPSTGKYQRMVLTVVVDTKFQLRVHWSRSDWFPIIHRIN
jgi:hypothetical protein